MTAKKERISRWQKKQTAGRDRLGTLAPKFAALFFAGLYPQLKSHLVLGKEHGITKEEVVEIVTQFAFYCGWPKAWSAFPLIQEVYEEESK